MVSVAVTEVALVSVLNVREFRVIGLLVFSPPPIQRMWAERTVAPFSYMVRIESM